MKAVSSALPFLAINPTSGVDLDNAGEFLRNGAASVGLVAPLFDPAAIARGDFDQIGSYSPLFSEVIHVKILFLSETRLTTAFFLSLTLFTAKNAEKVMANVKAVGPFIRKKK